MRKVLGQQGSQVGGTRSKTWASVRQDSGWMDPELEWEFPPIGVLRPSGKGGSPREPHTVNAPLDEDRHLKDGGETIFVSEPHPVRVPSHPKGKDVDRTR